MLKSMKSRNDGSICFYPPAHWGLLACSWRHNQESSTQTEAGTHSAGSSGSSGISVQTGFLFTLSFPARYWVPQSVSTFHLVGIWYNWACALCLLDCVWPCWGLFWWRMAVLLFFLRTVCSPWIILSFKTLSRYFLKVCLMQSPWVSHDWNVPRIHSPFLSCFPSNVFYIFSPSLETMWLSFFFPIPSSSTPAQHFPSLPVMVENM